MIEIETSYELDDSCQMKLWARGHYPWSTFMDAIEAYLKREDRNDIPRWVYIQASVKSVYQRCVPCRDSIVSDSMYVYTDKPGRGASPVTVLDFWFPIHRYFQRGTDKVDAQPLTGDEIRAAVSAARNASGPSDATQPGEYVLAGAQAVIAKAAQTTPAMAEDEISDAEIDAVLDSPGSLDFYVSDKRERLRIFARRIHAFKRVQPASKGMVTMIDAAMVEMQNMHPPMRRSDCERLIWAALGVQSASGEDARDPTRYRNIRAAVVGDCREFLAAAQAYANEHLKDSKFAGAITPDQYDALTDAGIAAIRRGES